MNQENAIEKVNEIANRFELINKELSKSIVGHQTLIKHIFTCLLCGGHALIEGVPGLGKTMIVRTLSQALELKYSRIQFTPDLMPADILGTNIVNEDASGSRFFEFFKGPIFGQIILADEINRATPKTQSALLEAMQENEVTVFGKEYPLKQPFIVLATQNPIEMEGTYPLPEAQVDRFFFKLKVEFPTEAQLIEIIDKTTEEQSPAITKVINSESILEMKELVRKVPIASHVKEYATRLVMATHPDNKRAPEMTNNYVHYGASPRGLQALVLAGKVSALLNGQFNVSFDDIKDIAKPALRHRIILNLKGEAEGINTDEIVDRVLGNVPISMPKS